MDYDKVKWRLKTSRELAWGKILFSKFDINHTVDSSECQRKMRVTTPIKCYFTSCKQYRKWSRCSQDEYKSIMYSKGTNSDWPIGQKFRGRLNACVPCKLQCGYYILLHHILKLIWVTGNGASTGTFVNTVEKLWCLRIKQLDLLMRLKDDACCSFLSLGRRWWKVLETRPIAKLRPFHIKRDKYRGKLAWYENCEASEQSDQAL